MDRLDCTTLGSPLVLQGSAVRESLAGDAFLARDRAHARGLVRVFTTQRSIRSFVRSRLRTFVFAYPGLGALVVFRGVDLDAAAHGDAGDDDEAMFERAELL